MHEEVAVFAGGCFWCTEALFRSLRGVTEVVAGYTGGTIENPTYEKVSSGATNYAEAIKIIFDPQVISYTDLLAVFFSTHDPTTLNRQGADVGTQYRSAIFYTTEAQKTAADKLIAELTGAKAYDRPIVTEVAPLVAFYPAESDHQDFYARNMGAAYCEMVIEPKLEKLQKRFAALLKDVRA